MTWSWNKLSAAKWEDAWSERIAGNPNAVITKIKGGKTVRITVYCDDEEDALALKKYFGGTVRKIRIHFDNDIAGRKAAQTLKTILPDKYEIVDEPPKAGKDFNDFLCMRMEIYNKKTHERNEER